MPVGPFSGGSYTGNTVPYYPSVPVGQISLHLDIEQAEMVRLQRYAEAQRFYLGQHWSFKRESGDPLHTTNYVRKFVDKSVEFLAGRGFTVKVPTPLSKTTLPYLRKTWKKNLGHLVFRNMGTTGAVTGDVFVLVSYKPSNEIDRRSNPRDRGKVTITLLKSEYCFPVWDPLDTTRILSIRIETLFYDKSRLATADRTEGTAGTAAGAGMRIRRFTQIITPEYFSESYDGGEAKVRPNLLGEVPVVHISNVPMPGEFYGMSDVQDLIDLQRTYNETATDIADVVNYQAAPVTAIFGARAKNLERGAKNVWSGLPADARIQTVELGGSLGPSEQFLARIKESMFEVADIPEGSLGKSMPISNTSGVALGMMMFPLVSKTNLKKLTYVPGMQEINRLVLRTGAVMGEVLISHDLCAHCGGRIVQYEDPNSLSWEWIPETGTYEQRPAKKLRCYHVDPQTLEFVSPEEMRLKYMREYGFGSEVREAPLWAIVQMVKSGKPSFWDYTADKLKEVQEARKKKEQAKVGAVDPETGQEVIEEPDRSMTLLPKEVISVPEEPERVNLSFPLVHPVTGEVIRTEVMEAFLVPTGCTDPEFIDPYETDVDIPEALPKDDALEANLFQIYQANGWVDADWCRRHVKNIAPEADEIEGRMKKNKPATAAAEETPETQEAAPTAETDTKTGAEAEKTE